MKSKLLGACLAMAMVFGSLSSTGEAATLFQRFSALFQTQLFVAQSVVEDADELQSATPAEQLGYASGLLQLQLILIGSVFGGQSTAM